MGESNDGQNAIKDVWNDLTRLSEAIETMVRCFNLIICALLSAGRASLCSEFTSEIVASMNGLTDSDNHRKSCMRTVATMTAILHAARGFPAISKW